LREKFQSAKIYVSYIFYEAFWGSGVHAMDLLPWLPVTMRNEKRFITKGKKYIDCNVYFICYSKKI